MKIMKFLVMRNYLVVSPGDHKSLRLNDSFANRDHSLYVLPHLTNPGVFYYPNVHHTKVGPQRKATYGNQHLTLCRHFLSRHLY